MDKDSKKKLEIEDEYQEDSIYSSFTENNDVNPFDNSDIRENKTDNVETYAYKEKEYKSAVEYISKPNYLDFMNIERIFFSKRSGTDEIPESIIISGIIQSPSQNTKSTYDYCCNEYYEWLMFWDGFHFGLQDIRFFDKKRRNKNQSLSW